MHLFRMIAVMLMFSCLTRAQTQRAQLAESDFAQRQIKFWTILKRSLTANGTEYFELNVKDAEVPGGLFGLYSIRGTVLSSQPALNPRAVILAISTKTEPEVRLEFNSALDKSLPSGTEVDFTGVVRAFTPHPFLLTFEVMRLTGLH